MDTRKVYHLHSLGVALVDGCFLSPILYLVRAACTGELIGGCPLHERSLGGAKKSATFCFASSPPSPGFTRRALFLVRVLLLLILLLFIFFLRGSP